MKNNKIHVVGSGLVGTLAAITLAQKGFKVELFERRGDMRKGAVEAGRSINLAVTARGLLALEQVGLMADVLKLAIPMRGRMLHDAQGNTSFVPYGQKESEVINSVSRGELNKLLLQKAGEYKNVRIAFRQRCVHYAIPSRTLGFVDEDTGKKKKVKAEVVIGTDGAWSALRKAMLESVMNFNYAQSFCTHGYKELSMPPAPGGGWRMEKNALHIWPRKRYMLIALPNLDGSFTCTLFFPYQGEESFETVKTGADARAFFSRVFPDALAHMPELEKEFVANPTGSMVTVKCNPWHVGGQAMLLGDAAHAIVPFFGQGMNCGFEDCSALGALLSPTPTLPRKGGGSFPVDWASLFAKLEAERKPNADAIADMALENFVEMRDTVADPKFQLKKHVGFELERRFPGQFIPRYAMVVFHPEIPYAEARRLSAIQDNILEELCEGVTSPDQVDWGKAGEYLRRLAG